MNVGTNHGCWLTSGTFMWMPVRTGGFLPWLMELELLIEPTSVSNAEATTAGKTCNSCRKLTCLSHYERGHITRGAAPSHSRQIGYVKPLNPSQGYQCCLSTVYTFPSFRLAVSSHTSVVLETNLRIQQWTDYPTLSSLFPSGPHTLIKWCGHQMQDPERGHPFLTTSWVMIRTLWGRVTGHYIDIF